MIKSAVVGSAIRESKVSPFVAQSIANCGPIENYGNHSSIYLPTEALCATAAIMAAIRTRGEVPVREPIQAAGNLAPDETIFVKFANSVVNPEASSNKLRFTQSEMHGQTDACRYAELCFSALLRAKQMRAKEFRVGPVMVFSDDTGEPIFIQKSFGVDSALGLTETNIDGIDYPAGTLYSLYSVMGKKLHKKYQKDDKAMGNLAVKYYSTAEVSSIAPVRLSLYALPADERLKLSPPENFWNIQEDLQPHEKAMAASADEATLSDFQTTFKR